MLAEFNLGVDEMFCFSSRTQEQFAHKYSWEKRRFNSLINPDDEAVKLAWDHLGMYAYAKARNGERWTKEFMEGFAYRFPQDSVIVESETIFCSSDRKLMMRYVRFCYWLVMKAVVSRVV